MKIILDTNVITKDYQLQGGWIVKLGDAAHKLGYEVFLPRIVIDELFHQFRIELEDAYGKYQKGLRMLNRLGLKNLKDATTQDYIAETYNEKQVLFMQRLEELGVKVLPYPKVAHEKIVAKELNEQKPFVSSQKGYRDSLIWECVKEQLVPVKDLLGETQILFLSANTRDFADKTKELHPDLVEELTSQGYNDDAVVLVSDFDKFFNDTINTELEELDKIAKTLLEKRKFSRFNLDEELLTILYDEYVINEALTAVDDEDYIIPREFENPEIQDVSVNEVKSVKVHQLTDGTSIVDCEVEVLANMEGYIYRGDLALFDEDNMPDIIDWEWNEHYYLAAIQAKITALASFRVTEGFYRVKSKELHTKSVKF